MVLQYPRSASTAVGRHRVPLRSLRPHRLAKQVWGNIPSFDGALWRFVCSPVGFLLWPGRLLHSIRDLASLEKVEVLHLYNVEEILKRIANCNPSRWRVGVRTAEEMLTGVKEAFVQEEQYASEDEASEDEASEDEASEDEASEHEANEEEASEEGVSVEGASEEGASEKEKKSLSVSFHPAAAFYKTFGSYGHSQKEAWYRSIVSEPLAKLVALRQKLADRTGEPLDYFSGLSKKNVETILDTYKG
ncbi:hypothetical protein L202_08125 [Cryptococcus amylolentus CBS 6039]|uniref:Uncharacterized protein n=1 Tax=Cryptococcus amylolentus CBS 6039 TaxID=1295533 RepID=A0A1E3HA93_9TREE|nr:hypothetical protein L202_08125 [Cryptococcus amylolentus CBS 6039]ODN72686.1 hypothetical protein L202_08125 [Cryptococcus amylolentus CBS 6039]